MTSYSRHARNRMRRWRITEAEVEAVLAGPDERRVDIAGHLVLIGWPGGRRIKVVVQEGTSPLIITVAARRRP